VPCRQESSELRVEVMSSDVILTEVFPFSAQVELNLKKSDGRSWTLLEKTTQDLGGFQLTFGVGGRTGTIGAKEIIVDPANQPQPRGQ